jgi:hypothetical protein
MPIAKTLDGTKLQNCRNHIKAKGTRYINHKHWNKIKKGNESSLIHLEPQRASHYKKLQENLKSPIGRSPRADYKNQKQSQRKPHSLKKGVRGTRKTHNLLPRWRKPSRSK